MIELTWRYKRSIGIIGDTHVGDRYAIWPPDFVNFMGNPIPQNPAQRKLWEFWMRFAKVLDDFQVQEIWSTGDLMQGQNHKEQALGLITSNMWEQRKGTAMALTPLLCGADKYNPSSWELSIDEIPPDYWDLPENLSFDYLHKICMAERLKYIDPGKWVSVKKMMDDKAKAWYKANKIRSIRTVGGSQYHQGATPGQFPEQVVIEEMLEGQYHGSIFKVRFADSKRVFMLSHGGGGSYMYPEMQAGRELMTLAEWETVSGEDHVDAFICGHLHHAPMHIEKYGQHFMRTGCWQIWSGNKFGFNPYGRKQPKCNTGILLLDDHDRIRYIPFDFKPMPKVWDATQVIGEELLKPTEEELDTMVEEHHREVKEMDENE